MRAATPLRGVAVHASGARRAGGRSGGPAVHGGHAARAGRRRPPPLRRRLSRGVARYGVCRVRPRETSAAGGRPAPDHRVLECGRWAAAARCARRRGDGRGPVAGRAGQPGDAGRAPARARARSERTSAPSATPCAESATSRKHGEVAAAQQPAGGDRRQQMAEQHRQRGQQGSPWSRRPCPPEASRPHRAWPPPGWPHVPVRRPAGHGQRAGQVRLRPWAWAVHAGAGAIPAGAGCGCPMASAALGRRRRTGRGSAPSISRAACPVRDASAALCGIVMVVLAQAEQRVQRDLPDGQHRRDPGQRALPPGEGQHDEQQAARNPAPSVHAGTAAQEARPWPGRGQHDTDRGEHRGPQQPEAGSGACLARAGGSHGGAIIPSRTGVPYGRSAR